MVARTAMKDPTQHGLMIMCSSLFKSRSISLLLWAIEDAAKLSRAQPAVALCLIAGGLVLATYHSAFGISNHGNNCTGLPLLGFALASIAS